MGEGLANMRTRKFEELYSLVFGEKDVQGGFKIDNLARSAIDQICSGEKNLIPKFERHMCMRQEGESNLNYVPMLALSGAILLMSMRAGN